MDVVQLQCGNCRKLMAIGAEHLGGQVQCPHCQAVVQTPAALSPKIPSMQLDERDSIFADQVTEDVIGGPAPRRETTLIEPTPAAPPIEPPAPKLDAETDLTTFQRPRLHGAGMGPMLVMIFLVPYAILMTLFVAYLLYVAQNRSHPLDTLPDSAPGKDKGAPRQARFQIAHDHALAQHQKVRLGEKRQIGDILVEPKEVRLNEYNELLLVLRTRNMSADASFVPMNDAFVRYVHRPDGLGKPYTYLESNSRNVATIYGGIPSYLDAKGEPIAMHLLRPGEEAKLGLLTAPIDRLLVKKIASTTDRYTWRIQLRRGFVKHHGKNISATTVFGIDFSSDQIVRPGKKDQG